MSSAGAGPPSDEPPVDDAAGAALPHIPLLEDADAHPPYDVKPTWRGWIHAGTFPLAIAGGIGVDRGFVARWFGAR